MLPYPKEALMAASMPTGHSGCNSGATVTLGTKASEDWAAQVASLIQEDGRGPCWIRPSSPVVPKLFASGPPF